MSDRASRRLVVVWLALMAATALSWWVGGEHGPPVEGIRVGAAVALAVAFVKVHYVGLEFMELRGAPAGLRWAFEGWVAVVGGVVVALYALA